MASVLRANEHPVVHSTRHFFIPSITVDICELLEALQRTYSCNWPFQLDYSF